MWELLFVLCSFPFRATWPRLQCRATGTQGFDVRGWVGLEKVRSIGTVPRENGGIVQSSKQHVMMHTTNSFMTLVFARDQQIGK